MQEVDDILKHYGVKGMHWGIRNKRTASVDLTSKKTGKTKKIYYNPKKLNPNGPTVGNKRQITATKREGKNFQKQLNKASKEIKPKAKTSSDYKKVSAYRGKPAKSLTNKQLKTINDRANLEQNYNRLNPGKVKKGEFYIKAALGTAGTAVAAYNLYNSPAGKALMNIGKKTVFKQLKLF